jgi:large subunit ribosomal protein L10
MDNPRPEKVAVVTEVREHFERSSAAILTEYRGLTVKDLAGLRRTLRESGGEYKIYKNTLVRFAAHDLGLGELDSLLTGPTAIAFVDGDAAAVAKALREYARTNPKLTVKGGVLGTRIMSVADATALADLPPREVVLARLAGALASPMQTFAGLLAAVPRNFAYGLKALLEKRGGISAESPDAADTSAPVDLERSTSSDVPAAPSSGSAPPDTFDSSDAVPSAPTSPEPETATEPVAAVAPEVDDVAESVAEVVPEPPLPETSPDDAEPAQALVADTEPAEPEPLEVASEAALTPALVDEPPEVEPLAAHGIPAEVEPRILSVEPEPVDEPSGDTPSAQQVTPDGDTPSAN